MVRTPRTHSRSGKSPVTIDLQAETGPETAGSEAAATGEDPAPADEVTRESTPESIPESTPDSARESASDNEADGVREGARIDSGPRRRGGLVAAALAGGLLGIGGAAVLDRYVAPEADPAGAWQAEIAALRSELGARIDAAEAAGAAAAERVTAIDSAMEELRAAIARAEEAIASAEGGADLSAVEERLAALDRRITEIANGAPGDPGLADRLDRIEAGLEEAGAAGSGLSESIEAARAAIDRHEAAISTLQQRLNEISGEIESGPGEEVALALAVAALKSAVERGTPFGAELEAYAALVPDAEGIADLRAMAATGVPTRTRIEADLPDAIQSMVAAVTAADPDAGFFRRLIASLQSLIKIRPVGEVEGNTPFARLARIEVAIRGQDYARALAEYEALPDTVRHAGSGFFDMVDKRARADSLLATALSSAPVGAG